jgi:hypothetical protein
LTRDTPTAGACTDDAASKTAIDAIKTAIANINIGIKQKEKELNTQLKSHAQELRKLAADLKTSHQRMSGEVATKLADLKARGIATDIPGPELLLRENPSVAKDISDAIYRQVRFHLGLGCESPNIADNVRSRETDRRRWSVVRP